ncbi:MAG TPA: adenylate/guanylate cyclase domain-containing protein [Actinomycetota bacterium]
MARAFSAEEIAAEAGVPQDRVTWLVSIGIVKPGQPGEFRSGDVFRVKLVSALLDAGLSEALLERAVAEGWLNLDHVDAYLPLAPAPRSSRTFADFVASAGPAAVLLPALYEVLGLPRPDPAAPIHVHEEAMLERFLEGWRLASGDDVFLRAARLLGEGTRVVAMGWTELLDEQMGRPAQERMFRGEIDRFPQDVALAAATLVRLAPEMFTWLSYRYIEQRFVASIVEGIERFLATRDVVPMPQSQGPPAIVFVDLSGFTSLTEERGDEAAVRAATSLQRHADAVATQSGGRLVKLLGDGALLRFSEVKRSVEAAVDLVETMGAEGSLSAHAGIHTGPVIERDLDVFGGTVNLASRIAGVAGRGEVLVSRAVVDAVEDTSFGFEHLDDRSLKGIAEPVALFRVTRNKH